MTGGVVSIRGLTTNNTIVTLPISSGPTPYFVLFTVWWTLYPNAFIISDSVRHAIYYYENGSIFLFLGALDQEGFADGSGTAIRFNNPRGVSIDNNNFLWVADTSNAKIRVINLYNLSTMSFLINGLPLLAPVSIHIESGNYQGACSIWVSDTNRIFYIYIDLNNVQGFITIGSSISGFTDGSSTEARFQTVIGITSDTFGNIYVADTFNNAVRCIQIIGSDRTNPLNYYVTTIATFDENITSIFLDGNKLYVGTSNKLYTITLPVVTTLAGSNAGFADGTTSARFNSPSGVSVDDIDNIYVADTNNYRVRKITAGVVTTIAGSNQAYIDGLVASARFNQPSSIATYSNIIYVGELYTVRSIQYFPNRVTGGTVTANTNTLFTSVVQLGVYNGVNGYLNGSLALQGTIVGPFGSYGTYAVGKGNSIINGLNYFAGSMKEMIIFNTALTDTQRQSVESYLTNKWMPYTGKTLRNANIYLSNNLLEINGNLYASNLTAATFTAQGGLSNGPNYGFYYGNGQYVTTISDRRLKEDIRPIDHALDKVSSMQAVRYRLARDPSQPFIGYIAQDLQPILPEVVRTDPNGWMSIQYANLPGLIIEAVKELKEKYDRIRSILSTSTSI